MAAARWSTLEGQNGNVTSSCHHKGLSIAMGPQPTMVENQPTMGPHIMAMDSTIASPVDVAECTALWSTRSSTWPCPWCATASQGCDFSMALGSVAKKHLSKKHLCLFKNSLNSLPIYTSGCFRTLGVTRSVHSKRTWEPALGMATHTSIGGGGGGRSLKCWAPEPMAGERPMSPARWASLCPKPWWRPQLPENMITFNGYQQVPHAVWCKCWGQWRWTDFCSCHFWLVNLP